MVDMLNAYLDCALWSSPMDNPEDESDDTSFDSCYDRDDVSENARRNETDTIQVFLDQVEERLGPDVRARVQTAQGGHDFWLSRNGHGAGFFDRDANVYGGQEINDALQDLARAFGERHPYESEDGICFE